MLATPHGSLASAHSTPSPPPSSTPLLPASSKQTGSSASVSAHLTKSEQDARSLFPSSGCSIRCEECDISLAKDFPNCFLTKMVGAKRGPISDVARDQDGQRARRRVKRVEVELERLGQVAALAGEARVSSAQLMDAIRWEMSAKGEDKVLWPHELIW